MNYEELLKRAMEKLPKKSEEKKRFSLPEIEVEFSGTRTIFKNFGAIANFIRREYSHFSKYLLRELATPGSIEGSSLIFQRRLPISLLKEKIDSYLKKFVFCKICGEPDSKIVKEDRITFLVCEACGAKYPVEKV